MFGFFKNRSSQSKTLSAEEYQSEFNHLKRQLYDKFAIEGTAYDELLESMAAVEDEMNRNGGCNWNEGNYARFLTIIEEHLSSEPTFGADQLAKIKQAVAEIAECGRELEVNGESGRNIEESIDYLIARVVDWCHLHPTISNQGA